MEGLKTSQRGDNGWPVSSCELRRFYFLATRGTRIWGTGMGTAGTPKRENHVKGQACLVCKRNSLLPLTLT